MTTINIIFLWIGLGGMAAGVYHDSTPLTVSMAALFCAGHRYLTSIPSIVTFVQTQKHNDKTDTDK